MQKNNTSAGFGALFGRGWSLYKQSFGTTFPITLLCAVLPLFLLIAVVYYGIVLAFEPVLRIAQAVFGSLLESGFDEAAMGKAMETVLASFRDFNLLEALWRMLRVVGGMTVLVMLMLPVQVGCALILLPTGRGAAVYAQHRAIQGENLRFSEAFRGVRRVTGKLMGLNLAFVPVHLAGICAAALLAELAGYLPSGDAVAGTICVAAAAMLGGTQQLAVLVGLEENVWGFAAMGRAFKLFFTRWSYLCAGMIFYTILFGCGMLVCFADVWLMIMGVMPPLAIPLTVALALPLQQALVTAIYQDQRAAEPPVTIDIQENKNLSEE